VAGEMVRLSGRTLVEGEGVVLSFPGTEIRVRFRGSKLALSGEGLTGANWFNRRVDGQPQPRLDLTDGTGPFEIVLAKDLDPDVVHEVRLVRRNEAWQGTVRLDRFSLPEGGEFLDPPAARPLQLMCLGDSITCGHGTELIPPFAPRGNSTANAELTYGWALAARYGADLQLVSYGGRGLVRDWQGNRDALKAVELFERSHADRAEPAWDHSRDAPALITICFGTNDYASGVLKLPEFTAALQELVDRVHAVHPGAKVLLLSSPMLASYAPGKSAEVIAALYRVKRSVDESGGDWLRVHVWDAYAGTPWDSHPTGPQHQAMARELFPLFEAWLGWSAVNPRDAD